MATKHWRCFPLLALLMTILAASGPVFAEDRDRLYSDRELDNLLAPIALYPDALLSQILMAATYPAEVVEAARWVDAHPGIDSAEASRRAERMGWEPSVQALVLFPDVLARMEQNLDWTHALGDAWLLQEGEVIDAIQRLRDEAWAAGHLQSREYVHAYRDRNIIIIEPPRREVVYVPYYDPVVIYGRWWQPFYPSFSWGPPPGFHHRHVVYWGRGISVAPVFYYSTFHWSQRHVVIVDRKHYRPHYSRGPSHVHLSDARRWRHDPGHRRGVEYRHSSTREHYRHSDRVQRYGPGADRRREAGHQGHRYNPADSQAGQRQQRALPLTERSSRTMHYRGEQSRQGLHREGLRREDGIGNERQPRQDREHRNDWSPATARQRDLDNNRGNNLTTGNRRVESPGRQERLQQEQRQRPVPSQFQRQNQPERSQTRRDVQGSSSRDQTQTRSSERQRRFDSIPAGSRFEQRRDGGESAARARHIAPRERTASGNQPRESLRAGASVNERRAPVDATLRDNRRAASTAAGADRRYRENRSSQSRESLRSREGSERVGGRQVERTFNRESRDSRTHPSMGRPSSSGASLDRPSNGRAATNRESSRAGNRSQEGYRQR